MKTTSAARALGLAGRTRTARGTAASRTREAARRIVAADPARALNDLYKATQKARNQALSRLRHFEELLKQRGLTAKRRKYLQGKVDFYANRHRTLAESAIKLNRRRQQLRTR
jgi:hypothetical protein